MILHIIYLIGGFLLGIVPGMFLFALCVVKTSFGTLKTAYDDGQPYLFLDLDRNPEEILKHNYVVFKVQKEPISHD